MLILEKNERSKINGLMKIGGKERRKDKTPRR